MKSKSPAANIIGVLDIYGFEIFDVRPFSLLPQVIQSIALEP